MDGSDELSCKWTVWVHLPYDTNWTLDSYTELCTFSTSGELVALTRIMEDLIKVCMVFIMKEGVNPMWEDRNNVDGGGFSYKIQTEHVFQGWRHIIFSAVGGTVADDQYFDCVTGVTISPKKNFNIVKIWMSKPLPDAILSFTANDVYSETCIYKNHMDAVVMKEAAPGKA